MKPTNVAVLLNPSAGRTVAMDLQQLQNSLHACFEQCEIAPTIEIVAGRQLTSRAKQLIGEEGGHPDAVVVAGGDGSIGAVARALVGTDTPLGIIPLGTLNHLAVDLALPSSLEGAVGIIASGHVRHVDVGQVNGHTFINNSSVGLYPYLVLLREWRRKRFARLPKWLGTLLATVGALREFPISRLVIRTDHGAQEFHSPCVFVGNNRYELSGWSVGRRRSINAGRLWLYVATPRSRLAFLWLALRSFFGQLNLSSDLTMFPTSEIDISSHGRTRMLVAVDGELEHFRFPLRYRVRPSALHVLAPD